jgi:hypothetical protein
VPVLVVPVISWLSSAVGCGRHLRFLLAVLETEIVVRRRHSRLEVGYGHSIQRESRRR